MEWAFNKITLYFTFVDLKRNNQILLQPVGKYYYVAALLTYGHTRIYGSQTPFFGVEPPSLETYLTNA